jgi:hypothetical protein
MTTQNPNANAQTTGAQQGNQAAVTPPVELTLKRHGREIKVPTDKAVELAQKGFDYEVRAAELAQKEAVLKGDQVAYSEYQQLKTSIENNPKLKQAFLLAMQNPDQVIGAINHGSVASDDDSVDVPNTQKQANDPAIVAELAALKSKIERRELVEQKNELETTLRSELTQYPWLVSGDGQLNRAGQAAFKAAVLSMAHSPEGPSAAAAFAANEQREVIEELQKQGLSRGAASEGMRMASMRGSITSATPPAKLDKKSFEDGTLRNAALEYARKAGLL